jgi:DnaJ-class molecular chaperone
MDFFGILNLDQHATPEQIKKQFRKLSLETHPDRPNGNVEKFQQINEAYEKLSQRPPASSSFAPEQIIIDMMMGGLNGGGGGGGFIFEPMMMQQPEKPANLVVHVTITLDQAFTGVQIPVRIERTVGRSVEVETCYVDVPEGVDHNEFIMLKGKGNATKQGLKGDAQVVVEIDYPPQITRNGWDLFYNHTVSLKEALCGFSFEFTYLQGKRLKLANNEGTIVSPTTKKTIPNMGMVRDNRRGSLVITFTVVFPDNLPEESYKTLATLLP